MQPLVSICIPTYNRANCLKQTLDSIVCQGEFLDGKVEVVINDNASTDNTEDVVKAYAEKYEGIHYYRNAQNVADKNFPIVLGRAHGKLRKLNNDTAVLRNNALSYLCKMEQKYEKGKPLLFFSNGMTVNNKKELIKDQVLDFSSFMRTISYWITWIISFSLWDSDCKNITSDFDGCELKLWQVKKICEVGSAKNLVAVCNQHIMDSIAPPKKDISYGLYHVFYENYFKIIDPYVKSGILSQDTKDFLEKDILINFFPDWIIRREMDLKELHFSGSEDLKSLVFNQCMEKPYWNEFQKVYKEKLLKYKIKSFVKKLLRRG